MRDITEIEIDIVKAHLKSTGTGVALNLEDMPKPLSAFKRFQGYLDVADSERLFLWFEYKKETRGVKFSLSNNHECWKEKTETTLKMKRDGATALADAMMGESDDERT